MSRYARTRIISHSLGADRTVVVERDTGARMVVPTMVAQALTRAVEYRTLADHAEIQARVLGLGAHEGKGLLAWFERLAAAGHLRSTARLREPLPAGADGSASASAPTLALAGVCLPSGNRATVLARTLRTYIDNIRAHGRSLTFTIVDTSTAASSDYPAALDEIHAQTGADIRYAGRAERRRLAAALGARGIDPAAIEFALFDPERTGQAYGTARNAALLLHPGQPFLSVDDDVECSIAAHPERRDRLRLFTGDGPGYDNYDPHDYWYFRDRDEVHRTVPTMDLDVIAAHEQYLGRQVRTLLAQVPDEAIEFDELRSPELAHRIAIGGAPVLVTFFGLRGDAGMYAPTWHLLKVGASRARLLADEDFYRAACTSRELMRCVPAPTVNDGRWYQTTMMGLDNRQLIPPTSPVMRYEDGVFRIVLHRMHRGSMCVNLPFTALHNRPPGYPWDQDLLWRTGTWTRTGEMLVRCLLSADLRAQTEPADRLRAMGRHLRELGTLPEAEFTAFLAEETMHQKGLYCSFLASLLELYGRQPDFWARDVERHLDAIAESCTRPEYLVPWDLVQGGRSVAEARTLARGLVHRFGRLLEVWPDMVAVARDVEVRIRVGVSSE